MTHQELDQKVREEILKERNSTNRVLELINMSEEKRTFLILGYSSLFDWLTRGHGYSNDSAYRRIQAARLLKSVPQVSEKLEQGKVNLSTLSKAQQLIRAQEKSTRSKITREQKIDLLEKIESKSTRETEQILLQELPEAKIVLSQEKTTVINSHTVRCHLNLSTTDQDRLQRLKEVLSHKFPQATDGEIISHALKFLLDKIDPLLKAQPLKPKLQKPKSHEPSPQKVDFHKAAPQGGKTQSEKFQQPAPESAKFKSEKSRTHELQNHEPQSVKLHQPTSQITKLQNGQLQKREIQKSVLSRRGQRMELVQRAKASCSYQHPESGRICGSRYQIQIDHTIPKAQGGLDVKENLRILCRAHNIQAAEDAFGRRHMARFIK